MASHDLQVPLRTVGGFTELLAASLNRDELNDAQRQAIDYILSGVSEMHRLIRDLLSYSRLEPSEIGAVSIREVHDAVVAMLAGDIAAAHATVTMTGGDEQVLADAGQVRQLVLNLIQNSLIYRCPDRLLTVTTTAQKAPHGMVQVSVADNGIGIAPADHKRVFEMFRTLKKGFGNGIGLAIVDRIVELNCGSITIDSDGSTGTTFRVLLPATPSA